METGLRGPLGSDSETLAPGLRDSARAPLKRAHCSRGTSRQAVLHKVVAERWHALFGTNEYKDNE